MNTANLVQAAHAAESSRQFDRAIQLCSIALSEDPQCVDALQFIGSLLARHGQKTEAEAFLRKAHAADPKSYDAARWLATLLIGENGGVEAVTFGMLAVQLRPNAADAHIALGLASLGSDNTALAIDSFMRVTELNPNMAGAHHNLGVAYQRSERYSDAIGAFKRAIEISPLVSETHLHLGRSYMANEQPEEALQCAERVLELNPNSTSAKRLRADAGYAAVLGEKGEVHIRSAIAKDPDAAFPYALLGSRLQEQGDFNGAEASLLKSIERQPDQGLAYYLLAHNRKVKESEKERFEAIEVLSQSDSLDSVEKRFLNFALGKAFDDIGNYEKAMRYLDLANEDAKRPETTHSSQLPEHFAWRSKKFIELITPDFLAQYDDIGNPSDVPIIIVGMPRSGTTLLEQIISRHSSVGAAGEQKFWRDSGRRIVDLTNGRFFPEELQAAGERYIGLLQSLAPGKAHVTDKFPSNYIYLGLLHLIYPNAPIIHARRHPVDTCLSMYMRPFFSVQEAGRTRRSLVASYHQYLESMRHWRSIFPPGRLFEVDYEQLVADPEGMIPKIIDHCNLEWEDACLHPEQGDRRVITFSKWQVRQPVYRTSVERWRNYEPWLGAFRDLLDVPTTLTVTE